MLDSDALPLLAKPELGNVSDELQLSELLARLPPGMARQVGATVERLLERELERRHTAVRDARAKALEEGARVSAESLKERRAEAEPERNDAVREAGDTARSQVEVVRAMPATRVPLADDADVTDPTPSDDAATRMLAPHDSGLRTEQAPTPALDGQPPIEGARRRVARTTAGVPVKPLRVAFDVDGVLADFDGAWSHAARQCLAAQTREEEAAREPLPPLPTRGRHGPEVVWNREAPSSPGPRQARVWEAIRRTENFWTALDEIEPGAVARIQDMAVRHHWEVFFLTSRPATVGDTVQLQTQQWLADKGFSMPAVLVTAGSRARAARALALDFLVDDTPRNCVDVKAESKCQPVLLVRDAGRLSRSTVINARKLDIQVAGSMRECLDKLQDLSAGPFTFMRKLARVLRWSH